MEIQQNIIKEIRKQKLANIKSFFLQETDNANIIYYKGNVCADVMILDECPRDINTNVVSTILSDILFRANVDEKNVYISNIYKYTQHSLTDEEIKQHLLLIDKEIQIVKPKKIILLGKETYLEFLNLDASLNKDIKSYQIHHPLYYIKHEDETDKCVELVRSIVHE